MTAKPETFVADMLSSNSSTLELASVVRFRRRSRTNPVGFEDFLQALRENTNLERVICHGQLSFCLTHTQWNSVIRTFGSMPRLKSLIFKGTRNPITVMLGALGDAMRDSPLLRCLKMGEGVLLAGTVREYEQFCGAVASSTTLQTVVWECRLRLRNLPRSSLNPLFRDGLARCQSLESVTVRTDATEATSEACVQCLCEKPSIRDLGLTTNHWQVVVTSLRSNSIPLLQTLRLASYEVSEEQVLFLVESLTETPLQEVSLNRGAGFTDTIARALRNALRDNKTVRKLQLSSHTPQLPLKHSLSAAGWEELLHLLRLNPNLQIETHYLSIFGIHSHVLQESVRQRMRMENALNRAGRARLWQEASGGRFGTKRDFVEICEQLLQDDAIDDDDVKGRLSCLYEIVRANPFVWLSGL